MSKTTKPPRRFKRMDELTVGEILEQQRTGVQVETEAYRDHRRQVLAAAGIEDESNPGTKPIDEMTAADFDRQMTDPGSAPEASAPAETPEPPEVDAGQLRATVAELAGDFVDPADAQAHIERAAAQGEAFTDAAGQIDREAIGRKLASILQGKPHLRTDPGPSVEEVDAAIRCEDA